MIKYYPEKQNFATVKKCEIQIIHLKEICGDSKDDQEIFLKGILNSIISCEPNEAENLLL